MTDSLEIQPCSPIDSNIRPPGSKSLTNRALICSVLAAGRSTLSGALNSQDTQVMIAGLQAIGFEVQADWTTSTIQVQGLGGVIPGSNTGAVTELNLANSGTSIRFLTALCAVGSGEFTLDGVERMRQRPIAELVDGLIQLGANVSCAEGCPPVTISAGDAAGGSATVKCDRSSQFLSALLMVLPQFKKFSVVQVQGQLVSKPYIDMTCQLMGRFGVDVAQIGGGYSVDPRHSYQAQQFEIEPDASAASYFWAAAAITGGRCLVEGLKQDALQGDVRFLQLLEEMGCQLIVQEDGLGIYGGPLKGIEANMNDISDTVQTLAAVALFADGPTTITGVAHIRHKETDRIGDLAKELRKLGAEVEEFEDGLKITPGKLQPAEIETYDDHRMAMALSIVGLKQPGIVIRNPGCTAKTYPGFFDDLKVVVDGG